MSTRNHHPNVVTVEIDYDADTEQHSLQSVDIPGDAAWTAEVDPASWLAFLDASNTIDDVIAEAIAASGRRFDGCAAEPCDDWQGTQYEATTRWEITAETDTSDRTVIAYGFRSGADAQHLVDKLQAAVEAGGVLAVLNSRFRPDTHLIQGSQLHIEATHIPAVNGACNNCGWFYEEHQNANEGRQS